MKIFVFFKNLIFYFFHFDLFFNICCLQQIQSRIRIMNPKQTLSITTSQPLCYRIPDVNLIDILPYLQQQGQLTQTQKNKVNYLLKQEQKVLQTEIYQQGYYSIINYYQSQQLLLKLPKQEFTQSQFFSNEVARIKSQLQNKQETQKVSLYPIFPIKLERQQQKAPKDKKNKKKQAKKQKKAEIQENINLFQKEIQDKKLSTLSRGYNQLRQLQLLVSQEISPYMFKAYITGLEKQQATIDKQIQKEQQIYQEINKKRRYQQLQAEQRFNTINDRIKIMMYKKIKPNEIN